MIIDWFSNYVRLSEICHLNTPAHIPPCLNPFDEKWQIGIIHIFQIQDEMILITKFLDKLFLFLGFVVGCISIYSLLSTY